MSWTSDGRRTTVDSTVKICIQKLANPSKSSCLITIIMMRYGIFSMRWASASRGDVSGNARLLSNHSHDGCRWNNRRQKHESNFWPTERYTTWIVAVTHAYYTAQKLFLSLTLPLSQALAFRPERSSGDAAAGLAAWPPMLEMGVKARPIYLWPPIIVTTAHYLQELIRRWDSKRQLFTTIWHVRTSKY